MSFSRFEGDGPPMEAIMGRSVLPMYPALTEWESKSLQEYEAKEFDVLRGALNKVNREASKADKLGEDYVYVWSDISEPVPFLVPQKSWAPEVQAVFMKMRNFIVETILNLIRVGRPVAAGQEASPVHGEVLEAVEEKDGEAEAGSFQERSVATDGLHSVPEPNPARPCRWPKWLRVSASVGAGVAFTAVVGTIVYRRCKAASEPDDARKGAGSTDIKSPLADMVDKLTELKDAYRYAVAPPLR